ncbi:MmyB family transcriptional regulator [Embleya sp. MST-111070]|uniref:MmyB family transcriptional regulator n=1 Tax=Embleya sp. MST-111070 TaxID=3398231 RepID=UPI003F73E326
MPESRRDRVYVLHHPTAGEPTLHGELVALPDEPACRGLDLFAAEPGSASERALRELGGGLPAHDSGSLPTARP